MLQTINYAAMASPSPAHQPQANTKQEPAYSFHHGKPLTEEVKAKALETFNSRSKTSATIENSKSIDVWEMSEMKVGKLLGTGSFSEAYVINNQESYVLKQLRPQVKANPLLLSACAADLLQEGRILATLSPHPNVIHIKAWGGPEMMEKYFNGSADSCFLVIEKLHETLEDKLVAWRLRSNSLWYLIYEETNTAEYLNILKEKCYLILNLANALKHLHDNKILHRDLKTQNIGFSIDGVLKVFDFDLARVLADDEKLFQMTAKVGSPRYMAPEVLNGEAYNLMADVYSFGILVYQILTLEVPLKATQRDFTSENKFIPSKWSGELRNMLEMCLSKEIDKRPNMNQILDQLNTDISETFLDVKAKIENPTRAGTGGQYGVRSGWLWSLRQNASES
jgi:serine/threonine protein kinase